MSFEIKRKVTYSFQINGKDEDLTADQLKTKITEAMERIKILQGEIRSREVAMNECERFVSKAQEALAADSKTGKQPVSLKIGAKSENVQKVRDFIEAHPNVEWNNSMLKIELGMGESLIGTCLRYLRDMRLVSYRRNYVPNVEKRGTHRDDLYKAKLKTQIPEKPSLPTVETLGDQDFDAIKREEAKKRQAMREN